MIKNIQYVNIKYNNIVVRKDVTLVYKLMLHGNYYNKCIFCNKLIGYTNNKYYLIKCDNIIYVDYYRSCCSCYEKELAKQRKELENEKILF